MFEPLPIPWSGRLAATDGWYHRVDDEPVLVSGLIGKKREQFQVRLQIYRKKDFPSIVVATQLPARPSPAWAADKIFNLAHSAYLGFPMNGAMFFTGHWEQVDAYGAMAWACHSWSNFNWMGARHRQKAFHGQSEPYSWDQLVQILGTDPLGGA